MANVWKPVRGFWDHLLELYSSLALLFVVSTVEAAPCEGVSLGLEMLGIGANDGPRAAAATARAEAIAAESAALTSYLEQNPTVLETFARDLLPLMLEVRNAAGSLFAWLRWWAYAWSRVSQHRAVIVCATCMMCRGAHSCCAAFPQVYASTVQPQVRTQALLTLSKMVHYSSSDILRCAMSASPGASTACTLKSMRQRLQDLALWHRKAITCMPAHGGSKWRT